MFSTILSVATLLLVLLAIGVSLWGALRPAPTDPALAQQVAALASLLPTVTAIRTELDTLRRDADARDRANRAEQADAFNGLRATLTKDARDARTELATRVDALQRANTQQLELLGSTQKQELDRFGLRLDALLKNLDANSLALRDSVKAGFDGAARTQLDAADRLRLQVQERLEKLQASNDARLEQMQKTVDEKLQTALETRLTESFKSVSTQLEAVQRGLGEMRELAANVGDLKRVMSSVKARGTWGEVLLGNLIEEILPPERFERNWSPPRRAERVEFAIKLPGGDDGRPVYLPIDAKFPKDDFERLQEASERGDAVAVEAAATALRARVLGFARDIRDKYIVPPHTTDFAILFLPTEGLYAEILRDPALADKMQREYRVVVAGPTTLLALLNSLHMGFRTLALQKKSAEIAVVLGAVKAEFGKFEEVITSVRDRIRKAADELDEKVGVRSRAITRKLKSIEALPDGEVAGLLGGDETEDEAEV